MLVRAFEEVLDREEPLDMDEGAAAVAAAQVVAALLDAPADDLPDYVGEWVARQELSRCVLSSNGYLRAQRGVTLDFDIRLSRRSRRSIRRLHHLTLWCSRYR